MSKHCTSAKAVASLRVVQQGRFCATALLVWFFVCFLWRVLGCGARARSSKVFGAALPRQKSLMSSTRHGAKEYYRYYKIFTADLPQQTHTT